MQHKAFNTTMVSDTQTDELVCRTYLDLRAIHRASPLQVAQYAGGREAYGEMITEAQRRHILYALRLEVGPDAWAQAEQDATGA